MTSTSRVQGRILRRETHSPRSTAAIAVAVVLMLVAGWLGVECVLSLVGVPALVAAPADMVTAVAELPVAVLPWALVVAGGIVGLVGLWLVVLAVAPGRRMRRAVPDPRSAIVVDDGVLASDLKHLAARATGVDPASVRASVGSRSVLVAVQPVSGAAVDREAVQQAVEDELARLDPARRGRVTVRVSERGSVGS